MILYIVSLLLGGTGAWFISRWGKNFQLLDKANSRSSHEGIIPKGGGIGILATFALISLLLNFPLLFSGSIVIVSLSSLYADRKEISPKVRIIIQLFAGIGVLLGLFSLGDRFYWMYLSTPFLLLYIVGTANYYNFMDGIDGIAGITGIVAFGLIALFAVISKSDLGFFPLALCILFSCIGFLPFNLPKARVFMGDVGSILLGFVYAGIVVGLSNSPKDFIVLCSFLFPFYADELTTTFVRLRNGDNLLMPHRRHVYQLLANEFGVPHWKISAGYGLLQLSVGISFLMLSSMGILFLLMLISFYFAGFSLVSFYVRKKLTN